MHDGTSDPTSPDTAHPESGVIPPTLPTSLWRLPAMRLVAVYTLFGFTGMFATVSALPAYLAAHETAIRLAGMVTTALLVMTVATQTLVPRMVRQLGLTTVLALGGFFLGAPSLLFLISTDFWWVLGISAVRGIGFGIITVLGSLLAARIVPPSRHGESIGIYGLAIAIPNVVVVAGAVALEAAGHFTIVALLGAVPLLGILAAPALARVAGTPNESNRAADRTDLAARMRARRARRTAGAAAFRPAFVLMVVTLASGGFMTYLPIAVPDGALATIGLLVWGATGALSRWRVGLLADRIGLRGLLPGASVLSIVGIGIVALGLPLHGAAEWTVILLGSAILGIGFGGTQNLTLMAAFAQARQKESATVSSIWNMGFDTGTGLGSGGVGLLTGVLTIPGALAVTGALILASMPWSIRSGRPPAPDSPEMRVTGTKP